MNVVHRCIELLTDRYLDDFEHCGESCPRVSDINCGYCREFAEELVECIDGKVLGSAKVVCEGEYDFVDRTGKECFVERPLHPDIDFPPHCFVKYKGKYYDAEAPDGVQDWKDLPLYRRYYTKKKRRSRR